ncbi:MAG: hypothetical protein PHT31_07455 [Candidatus Omnitrophica bacterium]|nr:hypothetical protein [Candidatus Omnitrophota bacterium]MDD5653975.1 hypothetical protein [Candidatus Omnitrophota bacterium]
MGIFKKAIFAGILVAIILIVSVALGEVICRGTDKFFSSITHLDYLDVFRPNFDVTTEFSLGGLLKADFNHLVIGGYGRPVRFRTNSMGFRYNKNVALNPDPDVIRILSLGDSFTTGYRIAQNQTFSWLLDNYLNSKKDGNRYEVLISCILHPRLSLSYLSAQGIKLKPNVVILGITLGNDMLEDSYVDITKVNKEIPQDCLSGEPFQVNGIAHPILDKSLLYTRLSNLFRRYQGETICRCGENYLNLYDLCNGLGFYIKDPPAEINSAYANLLQSLLGLKNLSEQYHFKFIVVLFPQRFQVQQEDWDATVLYYGLKREAFDLDKPNKLIMDFCKKENIDCIDPTLEMAAFYKAEKKNLYFSLGDMHWNALGNKAIYNTIKDRVYEAIRKRS